MFRLRNPFVWHKGKGKQKPAGKNVVCQVCQEILSLEGGNCKAKHFQAHHPEYRFTTEFTKFYGDGAPDSCSRRYRCLVCKRAFSNFDQLIAQHRH